MKPAQQRLLVFMATYNEAGNVRTLLNEIWQSVPHTEILVVDDNSPDGTGEILNEIAKINSKLHVIHRPRKLGLGTAHHLAMLFAIKHHFDILITMDADHSHNPKDIPDLVNKLSATDFVIGSRYMQKGDCDYSGYRKFLSISANKLARFLLGIPLHEFTTSFRAIRVSTLEKVNFVKMHNQGYSFFMESVYRFHQAKLRLAEIPINFRSRNEGNSKIPRFEIIRGVIKLGHLFLSKLLRRKMPSSPSLIEDACGNCHSTFLSELYPSKTATLKNESNAYKCSSMTHSIKPVVAKCLQCGFIQVPQSAHPENLEELYEDVIDHDYLKNMTSKKKTFRRAYKAINPYLPYKGELLEVGSYCGLFLAEAKKHGWSVLGIEPSKWAADHAKANFVKDVISGNLESVAPTINKQFDVVVTWDVLEHVRDPAEYLRMINAMLKENGTIALSTLDISSWFPRLLGRYWPWIMQMHLFYFDTKVLEDIFKRAGFEMLQVKPYHHYASLKYIYQKLCMIFPPPLSKVLLLGSKLIPEIIIPVSLGDVKLYIGKKSSVSC